MNPSLPFERSPFSIFSPESLIRSIQSFQSRVSLSFFYMRSAIEGLIVAFAPEPDDVQPTDNPDTYDPSVTDNENHSSPSDGGQNDD